MDLKGSLLREGNWTFFKEGKHCEGEERNVSYLKITFKSLEIYFRFLISTNQVTSSCICFL